MDTQMFIYFSNQHLKVGLWEEIYLSHLPFPLVVYLNQRNPEHHQIQVKKVLHQSYFQQLSHQLCLKMFYCSFSSNELFSLQCQLTFCQDKKQSGHTFFKINVSVASIVQVQFLTVCHLILTSNSSLFMLLNTHYFLTWPKL